MNKVSTDVAQQEVEKWLTYKKVNDNKKEAYKDSIETLVNAVADGTLVLEEDNMNWKHTLKFEIGSEVKISSLEYKPRLSVGSVHSQLNGVKPADVDGRILAYIAALTGKPKAVVGTLDTEDYSIAQAVAVFFL